MTPVSLPDRSLEISRLNTAATWLRIAARQANRFLTRQHAWHLERGRPLPPEVADEQVECKYFLLSAVHRAVSAVEALEVDGLLDDDLRALCHLMRHLEEHPDEGQTRPPRTRALMERFPDAHVGSLSWSNDPSQGTRIGGVLQVETLAQQLARVVAPLEQKLDDLLHEVGLLPYRGPAASPDAWHDPQSTPEEAADAYYRSQGRVLLTKEVSGRAYALYLADNGADGCERVLLLVHNDHGWECQGESSGDGGFQRVDDAQYLVYWWGTEEPPPNASTTPDGRYWLVAEMTENAEAWVDNHLRERGLL